MSFCQEGGRTNGYMAPAALHQSPSPATDSVHQSPPPKETPDQPPDIASLHQKEPSRSPGLNSGATISWCFVPLALSHKWYDTNEFGQFIISATLSDGMVELNSARNNLISIVLWETNLVPQEKFTMYNLFLIKNINLLQFDQKISNLNIQMGSDQNWRREYFSPNPMSNESSPPRNACLAASI